MEILGYIVWWLVIGFVVSVLLCQIIWPRDEHEDEEQMEYLRRYNMGDYK